jgi:ABC-2 type transport system ATP-binding protein
MSSVLLEIKKVSKVYPNKKQVVQALNEVDLTLYKGEVFALLGVNGAGKTTLSSILATLHPASSGDILFKGVSIYDDIARYRAALGFCPQKPNLDSYLSVEDNLIFAGRYYLMSHEDAKTRAKELMDQFKLTKYSHFNVNALSGGYKQRVSIARALMHRPDIVILDEPTVGLDPHIRRQLWQVIKELRTRGITIILTTHYLDEAEVLSDRVCLLSHGKVVLVETVKSLKDRHFPKVSFEEIFLDLIKDDEM